MSRYVGRRDIPRKWIDGETLPLIRIDIREHPKRKDQAQKTFQTFNCQSEINKLRYGDYVCGNTVIEFKTVQDFLSSIFDKRLKTEAIEQANHYPYHFVMIVGNVRQNIKKLQMILNNDTYDLPLFWNNIGSLCRYTTPLIVPDFMFALNQMLAIFKHCNDDKKMDVKSVHELSDNFAFDVLRLIHGIGDTKAKDIVKTLKLETWKDLDTVTREELLSVPGVGANTADLFLDAINKEVKFSDDIHEW